MDDITSDPPEDAYPAPKVCSQCGKNPPAPCYVICVSCDALNKKSRLRAMYASTGCVRYAETREPTTKQKNGRTRGNAGFGDKRDIRVAAWDEEVHHTEQNTRTEYHGDNYRDE